MNWAGLLIIGIAVFLVISGIQGSWAKFFPWIMSNTSSSAPQTSNPNAPGYVPPVNSKCPSGTVWDTKTGTCIAIA